MENQKCSRRSFIVGAAAVTAATPFISRVGWAKDAEIAADGLSLRYHQPAMQWVDALPVGNGRLGAMVFGGGSKTGTFNWNDNSPVDTTNTHETILLNADTLWSGFPQDRNNLDAPRHLEAIRKAVLTDQDYHQADNLCKLLQGGFSESFEVAGSLHLEFEGLDEGTEYSRSLDLADAVASVHSRHGKTVIDTGKIIYII